MFYCKVLITVSDQAEIAAVGHPDVLYEVLDDCPMLCVLPLEIHKVSSLKLDDCVLVFFLKLDYCVLLFMDHGIKLFQGCPNEQLFLSCLGFQYQGHPRFQFQMQGEG